MKTFRLPAVPHTLEYVVQWAADLTRMLERALTEASHYYEPALLHLRTPPAGTYVVLRAPRDYILTKLHIALTGSSPSVDVDLQYGHTIGSGSSVLNAPYTAAGTSGVDVPFDYHGIVRADDWIWLVLTNVSGVDYLAATIVMEPYDE